MPRLSLGSRVNSGAREKPCGLYRKEKKNNSRVLEQPGRDLSSLEVSVGFDIYRRYTSVVSQMPHPPEEGRQGSGSSWQREVSQVPGECRKYPPAILAFLPPPSRLNSAKAAILDIVSELLWVLGAFLQT